MLAQLRAFLTTKQYFIFDFDRTIAKMDIDWSGWHTGISQIYQRHDPQHGYHSGHNPHIFLNQMVKQHGSELLKEARDFNRTYEELHLQDFIPNTELIEFISNNATTNYVFSSNSRLTVLKGLDQLKIRHHFTSIVSKDEVSFVKPNPEGFSLIEGFNTNASKCLMIGDSSSDQQAAEAAGIDFLLCNYFDKE